MASGEALSSTEAILIEDTGLDQMALYVDHPGLNLDVFALKPSSVVKIIFGFKEQNLFVGTDEIYDPYGNCTGNQLEIGSLNNLSSKIELFSIVTKNFKTITRSQMFNFIYQKLFLGAFATFMAASVTLETIQA